MINITVSPPIEFQAKPKQTLIQEIKKNREILGSKLAILAHHYQVDEVFDFADAHGDSLELSKYARNTTASFIIFCGVHFMAETAAILGRKDQHVILPDLSAGCSMADMATPAAVESAWLQISEHLDPEEITPITYINSYATIKAFCGRNNGSVCTSSNAKKIIESSLSIRPRLFFFPDQHLGQNTCADIGISADKMSIWDPEKALGGLSAEEIKNTQVFLWKGYCSVHTRFTPRDIETLRAQHPSIKIVAHPECTFDVCQNADYTGSTSRILNLVRESPEGSIWGVGTEINLVNRLAAEQAQRNVKVMSLSSFQCLCATMYRIRLPYLSWITQSLAQGKVVNAVTVPHKVAEDARIALNRMMS